MTGKEIKEKFRGQWGKTGLVDFEELHSDIDVAISSERDRCAKIVWEYRGMCVSDESARALMEEVRRVR